MPATQLVHKMFFHHGAIGTPTGPLSTPYIAFGEYQHVAFYVAILNGASGVTGAAITLTQAKDAAGTGAKALSFTKAYRVPSWAAAAADLKWEEFAVTSDTFTSPATANLAIAYMIEIEAEQLDRDNDFRFVKLNMASGVANTACALAIASIGRNAGHIRALPSPRV